MQGVDGAGEAAAFTAKAGEIVAQFGIVGLDAVGLALAGGDRMVARIVDQALVRREGVGVVLVSLWAALNQVLHPVDRSFPHHLPAKDTARRAVYLGDEVGFVFLRAIKVNNSSSSAVSTDSAGCGGGSGSASACAVTQFATV